MQNRKIIDINEKIRSNPRFSELVSRRNKYSMIMTILNAMGYFGFILLIAFDKEFLAKKLGDGAMSLGIPIGVGVILFTIALTWLFIRRSNAEFDKECEAIIREVEQ